MQKALKAYKTEAKKAFRTGKLNAGKAYEAFGEARDEFRALPDQIRSNYSGFSDYLACNDALEFSELRAEFGR